MAVTTYKRRQPKQTALWQAVHAHYSTFLALARAKGAEPPNWVRAAVAPLPVIYCRAHQPLAGHGDLPVQRAFEKYIRCGILAHGLARVRCGDCGHDMLVAFSCKVRGLCPSCDGRRMVDTAAHLIDEVVPRVPVRQIVFTFPYWLRFKVAWDRKLLGEVHKTFARGLRAWMRKRARQRGISDGEIGAKRRESRWRDSPVIYYRTHQPLSGHGDLLIQRFGDGLRLNTHFHCLLADGVWHSDSPRADPSFHAQPPPTDDEVMELVESLRRKVVRRLMRIGVLEEDRSDDDLFAMDEPLLAHCTSASMLDRVAIGEREGELVWRIRAEPPENKSSGKRCATSDGFSVHANTFVPAPARDRLEKLIRYVARPPVCLGRLAFLEGGYVEMRFKSQWRDGSVGKVFEGPDAIAKLAMLIPPPNVNLLRYVGVYAGNHRWRDSLTPGGRTRRVRKKRRGGSTRPDRERRTWAELMRRAFALDVLACPCGGRREVIALIEQRDVIVRILAHLGLPTELVSLRPARPPPSRQEAWAMAGQQDPASCAPAPTRASDPDPWELADELVEEEDFSQAEAW